MFLFISISLDYHMSQNLYWFILCIRLWLMSRGKTWLLHDRGVLLEGVIKNFVHGKLMSHRHKQFRIGLDNLGFLSNLLVGVNYITDGRFRGQLFARP